ncbi:RNA binding protein-like protein Ligatin/Tma64 [Mytilinidion resinicola]|uniref:RNA binding protein-like protein Ligatin/Tma64 n=1 Tax=Mytilinidion resinicola TaxID=574789 RepID=A0A6A6YP39_9PEZI|nr:RNA binding protein-like protein Ligatin/Tma64 [Mytilinidion resinicola]KAF2810642.1 RNA binding protein-like protein Ligatin/Tma64 [Mytilinidion resinicola]
MFKKKPNIKPLSPLKSSDRRRTADSIIADFGIVLPIDNDADANPEDKTASVAALTTLRRSLLPENAQSARFTTTAGPELRQISGTVYVGAHDGEEQRILWVKVEETLYPTVYTLWHNPGILPLLYTPHAVVGKLQSGADLMTPGLQRGPPFPAKAKQGAVVAIASLESPTVPMVVGRCEIDVSALRKVQGAKGHAVQTFHWAGDEIWGWSSGGRPGGQAPEHLDGWDVGGGDDELAEQAQELDLEDGDGEGGVELQAERLKAEQEQEVEGEDVPANEGFVDVLEDRELSQKEIDDAFRDAFLYGVTHHMKTNKNQPSYGLEFPLSQSIVMSALVQPFLPAYTHARAASLQIKKTSWKNIKKFIKSLDKAKMLKAKDRDGNQVVILDIDFADDAFTSFKPYRLPKKDPPASALASNGKAPSAPTDSSDPSIGQKLKIQSLLHAKDKLAPIFTPSNSDPRGYYPASELKSILSAYIESENLVSPKNKRLITLNPLIANTLFTNSALDSQALAAGAIPRDVLTERFIAASAPFHVIARESPPSNDNVKPKAGAPPKIQIVLETRTGSKTVTKVHGIEPFFIQPQALADELRKACASSTSVDKLMGSSPKNPVMEILAQGPQKDAVFKALERRGVLRGWVEVVDKTKKKKK